MIIVLQCAGTKRAGAGSLVKSTGEQVTFLAKPDLAPLAWRNTAAHPDDRSDTGATWRELLVEYNSRQSNPLRLLRASDLYCPPAAPNIYRDLVTRLGPERVFVLSAGWGLIRSDFLTPDYDITFAREVLKKNPSKYRGPGDRFADFRQLPPDANEDIVFVGSKSYVRSFCELTSHIRAKRIVYYNSLTPPPASGCVLMPFPSANKRTWHYECAELASSRFEA